MNRRSVFSTSVLMALGVALLFAQPEGRVVELGILGVDGALLTEAAHSFLPLASQFKITRNRAGHIIAR
jgi:hypothetical protein